MVIGGYAYAIHAEPRYTKDLDIFHSANAETGRKLLSALADFGFESLDIDLKDLTTSGKIIQLGFPPFRIDLLNEIEGVNYDEARKNRITTKYGDETIYVIGKDDLITNKKASGRDQDMLDVKKLEEE
jgi:hypothetical protein